MSDSEVHHVTVDLTERQFRNLEALTGQPIPGGILNPEDVAGVLAKLVDHADQGVYRPGAWERSWLCSAFGYDWLENMEKDPRYPDISWERPKAASDAGPGVRSRGGRHGS